MSKLRPQHWLLILILAIGCLLRAAAIFRELGLDEIWSFEHLDKMHVWTDVFFKVHHDNNHYLNTLWMWWFGMYQPFWEYRIPALLAGSLFLLVASLHAFKKDRTEGIVLTLLLSSSAFFVRYASEARGFAIMLLFGLLSYLALRRFLQSGRTLDAALFGCLAIAAYLGHLTYAEWHLALGIWGAMELRRRGRNVIIDSARLHLLPLLFVLWLALVDFRFLTIGGGSFSPTLAHLVVGGIAIVFGQDITTSMIGWVTGTGVLAWLLFVLWRYMSRTRVSFLRTPLFASAILCGLIISIAPAGVTPRYFLPVLYGLVTVLSRQIALGIKAGGRMKVASLAVIAVFLAGNTCMLWRTIKDGLERFTPTLIYIAKHEPTDTMRIGSNLDLRAGMMTRYYYRQMGTAKTLHYVPAAEYPRELPEWYLLQSSLIGYVKPEAFQMLHTVYVRQHAAEEPGVYWTLYRQSDQDTLPTSTDAALLD